MRWNLLNTFDDFPSRVFFPVGTVEPHGPLPVGTDNLIADYLAYSLAERFKAGVIPLFPFGVNRSLYGYRGGISISPETFKNVIYEVCGSLRFSGVKEIVVFNGHGGNTQHLRDVLFKVYSEFGIMCASIDWWVIGKEVSLDIFGKMGGHGGMEELALVYMAYPEVSVSGSYPAYHPKDGIFTYPSPRSILLHEKGEQENYEFDREKFKEFADRIIKRLEEVLSEIFMGWESLMRK